MARGKKRITSVTTRRGDSGETTLADGSSIAKSAPRIHAIGSVDELNSSVGLLVCQLKEPMPGSPGGGPTITHELTEDLDRLQQELFDLGAHLATVGQIPAPGLGWLDEAVTTLNASLPPLSEFVIPGGTRAAALCHVCRTVCRRAERDTWEVTGAQSAARYLNRLSDVLFVMARILNTPAGGAASDEEPQWRGV